MRRFLEIRNPDCLYGGCDKWRWAQEGDLPCYIDDCWRCGFNILEDARRKATPLTPGADGLYRKIIPPKR